MNNKHITYSGLQIVTSVSTIKTLELNWVSLRHWGHWECSTGSQTEGFKSACEAEVQDAWLHVVLEWLSSNRNVTKDIPFHWQLRRSDISVLQTGCEVRSWTTGRLSPFCPLSTGVCRDLHPPSLLHSPPTPKICDLFSPLDHFVTSGNILEDP